MNRLLPACALAALLLAGCGYDKTVLVDTVNDTEIVAGLDYKDFEAAAAEATNAILASAKVRAATPAGKTYVVAVGKVVDATPMGIDTGLVTARIEEALLNDERSPTARPTATTSSPTSAPSAATTSSTPPPSRPRASSRAPTSPSPARSSPATSAATTAATSTNTTSRCA